VGWSSIIGNAAFETGINCEGGYGVQKNDVRFRSNVA
jgi:hypothetical protein